MPSPVVPSACLVMSITCLAACTGPMNESISPGEEPLPVFAEADDDSLPPPLAGQLTEPSLTNGHDRLGWPVFTVEVPVYRVETNPAPDYRGIVLADKTARQRGEYPTTETALDVTPTSGTNYAEGFTDLVAGTGAILLGPVAMMLRDYQPHPRSPQHKFTMVQEEPAEPLDRWFVPVDEEPDAESETADPGP